MEKQHNKSPAETGRFTPRMPCKRDCEQWAQRQCCLGQQDVPHPFPATCPQSLDRNIITRYYSAPRAKQPRWRPRRSAEVSEARRLSHWKPMAPWPTRKSHLQQWRKGSEGKKPLCFLFRLEQRTPRQPLWIQGRLEITLKPQTATGDMRLDGSFHVRENQLPKEAREPTQCLSLMLTTQIPVGRRCCLFFCGKSYSCE